MHSEKTLLLGGHISGMNQFKGVESILAPAEKLGFAVLQFTMRFGDKKPAEPMMAADIKKFKSELEKSSIKYVIALDPFITNLGEADIDARKFLDDQVINELNLCDQLGVPYLIIHPGTCSLYSTTHACLNDIADNITSILKKSTGKSMLLLQNMATGTQSIFYKFENLAQLYRDCNRNHRIGFCFDMCAAFAAGYSFSTEKEYEELWKEFDKIVGLPLLKAIHINDSQLESGSEIISHAPIGKGKIPYEAYRLIMNDKRFVDIPKIIEIPVEGINDYKETYQQLIDQLTPASKELYGLR